MCVRGWGGSEGIGVQPANAVFHRGHLKSPIFQNFFFILSPRKMTIEPCKAFFWPQLCLFDIVWLLGVHVGGWPPKGLVPSLLMKYFTQKFNVSKHIFLTLWPHKLTTQSM